MTHASASGPALPAGWSANLRFSRGRVGRGDIAVFAIFGGLILVALLAPWIAPHTPYEPVGAPFSPPGPAAWMGTDGGGRDIFSRVIFGLQSSLSGAAIVVLSGVIIGGAVGVAAGILGGFPDQLLMRITDVFLALPGPLLAIALVVALGPSWEHTLLGVAIVWWPLYARVLRGEARALNARPHMEAARLGDVSRFRLVGRHLLPGLVPSTLVLASLDIGGLVLTLAGLSFLGLGAPAPQPELGAMAAQGMPYLLTTWWVSVVPGVAVLFLALIANLSGDALRDITGTNS
jgi:ABC-type dipeptide/oligopeptide/nickel transport system permease subunit